MNRRNWLGWQARWSIWLALTQATWLGACAADPNGFGMSDRQGDQIRDAATGRLLNVVDVLDRARAADVVLLGELHDNPHHHQRRAGLLAALGMAVPVVVEHLLRGAAPSLPSGAHGDALRQLLERAGFDSRAWQWPLHEPVFAAIARAGHSLHGGNLARETVRRVAREGADALPADLKVVIDAAPLSAEARLTLDQDLQAGHCGQLAASRLPGMVAAQRGRDAAMALTLADELNGLITKRRRGPVVLLAGNGHARRDYGVPQLLASRLPGVHMLAIEFAEPPHRETVSPDAPFDIVWTTPTVPRDNPCAGFVLPPPTGR